MTLSLDYTQRLNLHALIGAQRGSVDELRMWWRLQDRIELSTEEKEAVGFKVIEQNGQSLVQWDAQKTVPVKEYEFKDDEFQRLGKAVKEWPSGFLTGLDRKWIEPLLQQLDGAASSNGAKKEVAAGLGAMG